VDERQLILDWARGTKEYAVGAYVTSNYPSAIKQTDAVVIGKALKVEREKCHYAVRLTQQDVANDLGWSRQKLSDIERGVVEASFLDVCRLCAYYRVTPFNLLAYGEELNRGK
jgi:DNA-binding XRE family transcriptional regulator